MKASQILFIFLLPCLATCLKSSFASSQFNGLYFVYKGMYMFNKDDVFFFKGNGNSKIFLNYTVTSIRPNTDIQAEMDFAILSDKAFENIGYLDSSQKKVLCCDSKAVDSGYCTNQGHILLPKGFEDEYSMQSVPLNKKLTEGSLSFDVKKTGVYFVLALSCDYRVGSYHIDAEYETQNPYGQLPAPQYGSLPFTCCLLMIYFVLFLWWLRMCAKYSTEIMSVHIIVLVILACFILDMFVKLIYLIVFNHVGRPMFFLAILSIVVDSSVRTLTRILTLFVCMGLGVTKPNLDDTLITFQFIVFGICYYLVSFADSYFTIYPPTQQFVEYVRFILSSSMDALVYFWIFVSLMDSMDMLAETKQQQKLAIYTKLRNLFICSVLVATVTLVAFSYVVINDLSAKVWKYQWLYGLVAVFISSINDGIWGLFYVFLFTAIMIMWMPSENTSAYAYHMQISTSEKAEEGGYEIPHESLIDENEDGHVIVGEVSNDLKPMDLVEIVQ